MATKHRLTDDQKTILLRLADAAENGRPGWVRLVCAGRVRETTTGCALVRHGLAERRTDGAFRATLDGYWMGDTLRAELRLRRSLRLEAARDGGRNDCPTCDGVLMRIAEDVWACPCGHEEDRATDQGAAR